MTPDVYTDLQVVNGTKHHLVAGIRGTNKGFCHSYQMQIWFESGDQVDKFPTPVVAVKEDKTYKLQFKRGGSDQDDGADMQINVGLSESGDANVVWVKARSNNKSQHFISTDIQEPNLKGQGPFVVAFNRNGEWPLDDERGLEWFAQGQTIDMGCSNTTQCLAVIDLSIGFPSSAAKMIEGRIINHTFSGNDEKIVWLMVMRHLGW
ncbi:hypothetical protein [Segnochrobactrum spirostomi]|uniref:Uncharacterized protein n=1 Tax=Segnochrobactrum spirostomi TaxID=2608987 RepID=A0A6A7Y7W6_9HYPH|nr:hypothetical protein [Segnochrobactrum spirostomi]MQT15424.1 hypothetical protein [Segnochrobactrum spirostomi]